MLALAVFSVVGIWVFSRFGFGLSMKAEVRMSAVGGKAEVICANAGVR
jgi:hypothetical protein